METINILLKILMYILIITTPLILGSKLVNAYPYNTISSQDQQKIDEIMAPFNKVFNFVRIAAGSVAVFVLILAGVVYMTAGSDVGKKEKAKNMATGVIVGLMIFVVAPTAVQYLIT
ncbi:hypothetical protein HZA97_07940 [Candidatus Woesearchaeota archaeon]|nr:hypothetical protein [Candidatus Woesearchaeota archaeon]